MRFLRPASGFLVPAVAAVAMAAVCGGALAQSRNGIDSAPLLPPAGVGTPNYQGGYPGYPDNRPQPAQPAPAPQQPVQNQPYQGIYGINPQQQAPQQTQSQQQQNRYRQPVPQLPSGSAPAQAPAAPAPAGQAPAAQAPAGAQQPQPNNDVLVVEPPAEKIANPIAVYAGLDKITGRITSFEVGIGETVQFGALQVTPRACYTRPPTEPQNTTSFTEVNEITLKGEAKRIFTGWMFASSPGLHGVEHPIYDVWLTDCKQSAPGTAKPGGQK